MRIVYSDTILFDNFHIRLFLAERIVLDPAWWTGKKLDTFWRFYHNVQSGGALLMENQSYLLHGDRFYFVPAGVRYQCHATCDIDHFYVHFDVLGMPRIILKALFSSPFCVPVSHSLNALFEALIMTSMPSKRHNFRHSCASKH